MAESGAVAWQFEQKGVLVINVVQDQAEELAMRQLMLEQKILKHTTAHYTFIHLLQT